MDTKRQVLNDYDTIGEIPFMQEILIPLFDKMKFKRVNYNHGSGELGRDFIVEKINEFNVTEYYAVVVKKGGIQNTSGKDKRNLSEVERQIGQSFKIKIKTVNGKEELPSKVIVACSGRISKQAKEQIIESVPTNYTSANVIYLSQDELLPLIDQHLPEIFHFKIPTLGRYLVWLRDKVREESCADARYSKILGKVGVSCFKAAPDKADIQNGRSSDKKSYEIIMNNSTVWLQGGSGYGKTYTVFQLINFAIDELKSSNGVISESRIVYYFKPHEIVSFLEQDDIVKALHDHLCKNFEQVAFEDFSSWLKVHPHLFVIDRFEKNFNPENVDSFIQKLKPHVGEPTILLLSRILGDFNLNFERKPIVYYVKDVKLDEAIDVLRESVPANSQKSMDCFHDLIKNGVLDRIPRSALAINILSHLFSEEMENSPNNAFEFFDMFFEVALGRWRVGRDANKAYDYNQVRALLEHAAFLMVESGESTIHISKLTPTSKRILDSVGETDVSPEEYIQNICEGSELCRINADYFEFSHRAFMEFLAGCEFVNQKWDEDFFIKELTNQQWEDALIFAAGSKKRSESLLLKLENVPADDLQLNFLKMKNIALVVQALYHSDMEAKISAINCGIDAAVKIRDDDSFHSIIKKKHTKTSEITATLVAMGMFSTFYGRKSLAPVLMQSLVKLQVGRGRAYLISALAAIDLKSDFKIALNSYLKTFTPIMSEPESAALEPFLNTAAKMKNFSASTINLILDSKRIKSLGIKTQSFLKTKYQEMLERNRRRP